MMHTFKKINLSLFILLFVCYTMATGQTSTSTALDKLWEGIGGKENWQTARYFMFTCVGGEKHSFAQGERKYLWDKQTGNCRFEGITTDDERIVVLFNLKTDKGTVYVNAEEISNSLIVADIIAEVANEFEKDAQLLFLPTAVEGDQASYSVEEEKLVGTQRYAIINVKNGKTNVEAAIDGQLYLDTQTGQIREWRPNRTANHFSVSGFKDIGGGLVLPTHFKGSDTTTSVRYPIAAALVNIEAQKFNEP